jgi:nucleoside-diphosphate-sugar epimerase
MKILITGGGGFIGSFLINDLLDKHQIVCLDHKNNSEIFHKTMKNVSFVKGDITDSKILKKVFQKPIDCVIHFAGILGNGACVKNPTNSVLSHIYGTQKLCQKSLENNVKHFIFASTQSVYSTFKERKNPLNETMTSEPDDFYGSLKNSAEFTIRNSGINYTILRFANVFGYNPHVSQKGGAIENFIKAVFNKNDISIYGSGKQKIDYVNVKDVCDCIKFVMKNSKNYNQIYNVGSGELHSIAEIAKIISSKGKVLTGNNTKIKKLPAPDDKIWPDRLMSIKKIKNSLGWYPTTLFKEGIDEIMEKRAD